MRILYQPASQKCWEQFFHGQTGHGLVGYRGTAYQRGAGFGSLLGGLLQSFLPVAKSIGKTVGKQALRTGAEVAADALSGRNIVNALEHRGKVGASKLIAKGVKKLDRKTPKRKTRKQKGHGLGIRPKTTSTIGTLKRCGKPKAASRKNRLRTDQLGVYLA